MVSSGRITSVLVLSINYCNEFQGPVMAFNRQD